MLLLKKEPRSRSKEDIKFLHHHLSGYLKKLIFSNAPAKIDPLATMKKDKEPAQAHQKMYKAWRDDKYGAQVKDQIILDILKGTLKVQAIPRGERTLNCGDVLQQICIIAKGNAVLRIPYDNDRKEMTVKEYFQYIKNDFIDENPVASVSKPSFKCANKNVMIDYNPELAEIKEIKEVYRNKEMQRLREEKNRLVNDLIAVGTGVGAVMVEESLPPLQKAASTVQKARSSRAAEL